MELLSASAQQEFEAAIALGCNLGNCLTTLTLALQRLGQTSGIALMRHSHWYETTAVGPPQPDYLNGCALLRVCLTPHQLLDTLLQIEAEFGRVRRERWGPRTLDLDLLLFQDQMIQTARLQVPHPRMNERAFVLVPLAEIAPTWVDPVTGKAVAELVRMVDCSGVKRYSNLDRI